MNRILTAKRRCQWLVALCLIGLPLSAQAEDEPELLAIVRARHRSAQEAIHSLSCTVKREGGFPTLKHAHEGKYWRSFDRARLQEAQENTMIDHYYLIPEGELRDVYRYRPGDGQNAVVARRELITFRPRALDVWREMHLEFERWLSQATSPPRVKREKSSGRDSVRVTMNLDFSGGIAIERTYWFDVGRNYLVWKRVDSGNSRVEWEMMDFIEPQPGVSFPTKRVMKSFVGGRQTNYGVCTLTNVKINEPIAKSVFALPLLPTGARCDDLIRKQSYPIDSTWQQIPGSGARPHDIQEIPSAPVHRGGYSAQSTAEPRSWTVWIAPASLALLVLAAAVWLFRRNRARSLQT